MLAKFRTCTLHTASPNGLRRQAALHSAWTALGLDVVTGMCSQPVRFDPARDLRRTACVSTGTSAPTWAPSFDALVATQNSASQPSALGVHRAWSNLLSSGISGELRTLPACCWSRLAAPDQAHHAR